VHLQVGLQVQVGHLVLVSHAQQLGQLGVGKNAALEGRVEAVVALHVSRDKLGHISLALQTLARQTHKGSQLIRDRGAPSGMHCLHGGPPTWHGPQGTELQGPPCGDAWSHGPRASWPSWTPGAREPVHGKTQR
jgi:hypothetical protein